MISLPEQQFDLMETFKKAVSNGGSVIKYVTSSFTSDATLLFVPTGVLASNQAEIERVLTDYSKQSHLISNQKIINKIITSNQIVEESIMTVSHSETINWLLPGVKATKKEIQLSLVSIMALEGNKVSQYRVYWDQASVLSQISVLPRSLYCKANGSEVTLPIVNSVQQLALVLKDQVQQEAENESPEKVDSNPRLNPQRNAPSQDFLQHDNSFRPSSRVIERPGGKTSNIFGTEEDAFRPSSRVLSRPGGKTNDIFNTGPEPETVKKPVLKPKSSDIFSDEPIEKKEVNRRDPNRSSLDDNTIHRPGHKQFQDLNNRSQFTIGEDSNTNEAIRTGKQINPTSNQSQISFGEVEPVKVVGIGRRDPNARSEEAVNRPSSRVLNNPGGKSTFSFA
ncbi:hypothetical protein HDV04_002785 [Boothiomyces sp. JEL0838]|nr:hypothetical protein HDV04_002785 [Boothiomyces sp. JEL0838]